MSGVPDRPAGPVAALTRTTDLETTPHPAFELVPSGYDPDQVEHRVAALTAQLAEVRVAQRRESRRADQVERELGDLQVERESWTGPGHGDSAGDGDNPMDLGAPLNRLMQVASLQADEIRIGAAEDAAASLERARAQAEAHREQIQRSLTSQSVALEDEAARRATELDERERRLAEADQTMWQGLGEAWIRSDRLRGDAHRQAERERALLVRAIHQRQIEAEQALNQLMRIRHELYSQLDRLFESLATPLPDQDELNGTPVPPFPSAAMDKPSAMDRSDCSEA